jgi:enoyl-CoA hydratase/carnithine racemase
LALCCDFRVAAKTATFATPEIRVGIIPTGGAIFRLVQAIGFVKAKELLLAGQNITGSQAEKIRLINKKTPKGKALIEAMSFAKSFTDCAPLSVKAIKDCMYHGIDTEKIITHVLKISNSLRETEDYKEGRLAFKEKRRPVWKGK